MSPNFWIRFIRQALWREIERNWNWVQK